MIKLNLDGFNEKQKEAITAPIDSPVLILSGAGSGKTSVLTNRIAYLITQGVNPKNILAVTFTNKAAREMSERLFNIVGDHALETWCGTFHGICLRLLRMYSSHLGYKQNFTIYDSDDQDKVLKSILKDRQSEMHHFVLKSAISKFKMKLTLPEQAIANAGSNREKDIAEMYLIYQDNLMAANAMDFDDLINNVVFLMRNEPQIKSRLQDMFQYIHLDEYQDINGAQYELISNFAEKHKRVFAVGDDFQCWAFGSKVKLKCGKVKNIENLKVGDMVQTVLNQKITYSPVTNIKTNILAEKIMEVTTETGHVLRVTPNHKCFASFPDFNNDGYEEDGTISLYMNSDKGPCSVVLKDDDERIAKDFLYGNSYIDAVEFTVKAKECQNDAKVIEKFKLPGQRYLSVIPATALIPSMEIPVEVGGNMLLSRIVSVKQAPQKKTVDVEVGKTGILVVDGVVSHNSIYKFRGADISNILKFEKDYPEANIIKLEQNYRSTKRIVLAANDMIKNNVNQKEKDLWTENPTGEKIIVHQAFSDSNESDWIAEKIYNLRHAGHPIDEIAVLYRANYQSRNLEQSLLDYNVPYQVIKGLSFFERKEVKDIMAYLRVIANHDDAISIKRIINVPRRGIGDTTVNRLIKHNLDNNIPLFDVIKNAGEVKGVGNRKFQLKDFADMIESAAKIKSVFNAIEFVMEQTRYFDWLEESNPDDFMDRMDNIAELQRMAMNFDKKNDDKSVLEFLQEISLQSDVDSLKESSETVKLMTVHSSKGLEFDTVFVCGMEEGIFPHKRSIEENDLEEERRLCYVALSRARNLLHISHCQVRQTFGEIDEMEPSRFIKEIPAKCIKEE